MFVVSLFVPHILILPKGFKKKYSGGAYCVMLLLKWEYLPELN
jgi:hypothetical protein